MEKLRNYRSYIYYLEDPQDNEAIEMRTIFVHEDERKKGFGTTLIKELIKLARGTGYKRITTYSSTNQTEPFGAFLIKNGFVKGIGESNYGGLWVLEINGTYTKRVERKTKRSVGKLLGNKKSPAPKTRTKTIKRKKGK